jgi:hypothetical protein
MTGYFLVQCGSTLAALVVLAAVGGWALFPFRSRERPYLWLVAPLAGIGILSLCLTGLFHGCRLKLPAAFGIALALNGGATLLAAWRAGLPCRRARDWAVGVAVLLLLTVGCVWIVQGSAIRSGEPTIVVVGGSDQFGYAHAGDWILRHPHQVPEATPERPYESWLELLQSDPRPGAFLLAALAGWVRGTTTLFSYDFATGVALCAGLLGFAASFARRPLTLLLLLATAGLSLWLRNSRTGYFGKVLTYPGYLLLAHIFIQTWRVTTVGRAFSLVALSTGFGLTLSPVALLALFAVLGGGIGAASLLVWCLGKLARGTPSVRDPGPLWKGAVLALAASLPVNFASPVQVSFACFRAAPWNGVDPEYIRAEALDVSINWERTDQPGKLRPRLIKAALVCAALAFLWAVACRAPVPAGLLLTSGLVVFSLSRGRLWSVYQFQGLLYPLALAGTLLLLQERAVWKWRWRRLAGCCLLLALAASRVPQMLGTYQTVTGLQPGVPGYIAQSQITSLVEKAGGATLDVCHCEVCPCLALLVELGARDIPMQLRSPSWQVLLNYRPWLTPRYPRRGDYLLTKWFEGVPSQDRAFTGVVWGLVADEGVWIGAIRPPLGLGKDNIHGYYFWVGADRAEVDLGNCNESAEDVELTAAVEILDGVQNAGGRTVRWELAGEQGRYEVGASDREIRIPLRLPPGDHKLILRVEQTPPPVPPGGPGLRVLLFKFALRTVRQPYQTSRSR